MGAAFGGNVVRAPRLMHGKSSTIEHDGKGVFAGLTAPFPAARYHSLVVSGGRLAGGARNRRAHSGRRSTVMALRHREWPMHGVQFHPESILTSRRPAAAAQLPGAVTPMFPALLEKLQRQEDLSEAEAAAAMGRIMDGDVPAAQVAGLLVALRQKGERPAEIVGFARDDAGPRGAAGAGRGPTRSTRAAPAATGPNTFNISTVAAIVVAACGVPVAKHGNRSASSRCGSADVFEALGVDVAAGPAVAEACLAEAASRSSSRRPITPRCATCRAAPRARRPHRVQPARPAHQPAGARRQIVGVPRPELTELVAKALGMLGSERAWVVHGADGLDEISTTGYTKVSSAGGAGAHVLRASGRRRDCAKASLSDLAGGDAARTRDRPQILAGAGRPMRHRGAERRRGACSSPAARTSLGEGIAQAAAAIDRARARRIAGIAGPRRATERGMSTPRGGRPGDDRARRHAPSASRRRRRRGATLERPQRRGSRAGRAARRAGGAGRVRVIAECKRRSPSRGILRADYDPAAIARRTRRPARRRSRC
jgi:anthranilate phosphoribosyltransferase